MSCSNIEDADEFSWMKSENINIPGIVYHSQTMHFTS